MTLASFMTPVKQELTDRSTHVQTRQAYLDTQYPMKPNTTRTDFSESVTRAAKEAVRFSIDPSSSLDHPQVGLRIWLCFSSLVSVIIPLTSKGVMYDQIISSNGYGAYIGFTLIVALSIIGLLDVFINDLLPKRFRFEQAKNYRHLGFCCLALSNLGIIFVMMLRDFSSVVLLRYLLDAVACGWVAVKDVKLRYFYILQNIKSLL